MAGTPVRLEDFFASQEQARRLFETVSSLLEEIGLFEMRVTKSQIAFRRRRGFAWVWIPARYLRRSNTAPLVLSLALPFRDPSPRWKEVVEPYPGRFIHHLEIDGTGEIDDEVKTWLNLAWSSAR